MAHDVAAACSEPMADNSINPARLLMMALAVLTAAAPDRLAQDHYPNRTIRIIVPSAPGGGSDTVARLIAQEEFAALILASFTISALICAKASSGELPTVSAPSSSTRFLISGAASALTVSALRLATISRGVAADASIAYQLRRS